jgi:hypothetical protein
MRKLGALVALPMVGALVGIAPAAAQPAPEVTTFCDTALKVDAVLARAFSSNKKPSPQVQQEVDQTLAQAESTAPAEIAATVQSVAGILRSALQTGQDPSRDPTLQQSGLTIDAYRYSSCGYQTAEVTALEYEFRGLPKNFKTGTVAVKFTNAGAEIHELVLARLKGKDSVKKILALPEKERAKKADQNILGGHTVALPGQTQYTFLQLTKPGRYGAACFIPVGTTRLSQLEGHQHGGGTPHWKKGMYQDFRVEQG